MQAKSTWSDKKVVSLSHVRGHLRGADLRHLGMVGGQVLHEIRLGGELLLAEGTHQEARTT